MANLNDKGIFTANYHDYKKTVLTYAAAIAIAAAARQYPVPKTDSLQVLGVSLSREALVLVVSGLCAAVVYYVFQFTLRWRDETTLSLPGDTGELLPRIDNLEKSQKTLSESIQRATDVFRRFEGHAAEAAPQLPTPNYTNHLSEFIHEELQQVKKQDLVRHSFYEMQGAAYRFGQQTDEGVEEFIDKYYETFIPDALERAARATATQMQAQLGELCEKTNNLHETTVKNAKRNLDDAHKQWLELQPRLKLAVIQTNQIAGNVYNVRMIRHKKVVIDILSIYTFSLISIAYWCYVSGFYKWSIDHIITSTLSSVLFALLFYIFAWRNHRKAKSAELEEASDISEEKPVPPPFLIEARPLAIV